MKNLIWEIKKQMAVKKIKKTSAAALTMQLGYMKFKKLMQDGQNFIV